MENVWNNEQQTFQFHLVILALTSTSFPGLHQMICERFYQLYLIKVIIVMSVFKDMRNRHTFFLNLKHVNHCVFARYKGQIVLLC